MGAGGGGIKKRTMLCHFFSLKLSEMIDGVKYMTQNTENCAKCLTAKKN